ncbi:MAG: signal peptidase II [Alphaproteobacteria bacterium]|nr:signal peptidase II [Alphaproteobacteria bacterium]
MKQSFWKYIAVIIAVILADFITKGFLLYLITGTVPLYGAAWSVVPVPYLMAHVCNIFNIVFTWNPGASFSLFRSLGDAAPIVIIIATSIIIGCIGYYLFTRARDYERLPLALIFGGAVGNLIDRVRFGAVVDFLDFHIGALHWPAFNVADICIVLGVGLYLLNMYLARRRCVENTKTKGKK